jgi:membrane associated rhomboid family serine protease
MKNASHSIREELRGILAFIGAVWAVSLIGFVVPGLKYWGVVPRTIGGLVGIPAMPFLHAGIGHLLSNTVPLLILLVLLAGSKARSWCIVAAIVGLGGLLLWVFGRPANHIGASVLIFGLVVFLLFSGILERRFVPLVVSVLVGVLFGGSLVWGILPRFGDHVSWDGHLCGAVAGGIVSYVLTRKPGEPNKAQSGPT